MAWHVDVLACPPCHGVLWGAQYMTSNVMQGKPYRYGYAVSARPPTSYGNALSKFDMDTGTSKQWHETGCIPVEPVMIPRPGAQASPVLQCLPSLHSQQADLTGSGPTVCSLHLHKSPTTGAPMRTVLTSAPALVLSGVQCAAMSFGFTVLTSADLCRPRTMEWC